MTKHRIWFGLAFLVFLSGCGAPAPAPSEVAPASSDESTVFFSVTSGADEDPQSVDMAMKLAGFSIDEGRHVVMFFNVKSVTIPVKEFSDEIAFQDNSPIKTQLTDLIDRGVDVHVCPICMNSLGVNEADLIEGAKVTTRPSLFANIGANTAVFTY